jgi:hypothetical protein
VSSILIFFFLLAVFFLFVKTSLLSSAQYVCYVQGDTDVAFTVHIDFAYLLNAHKFYVLSKNYVRLGVATSMDFAFLRVSALCELHASTLLSCVPLLLLATRC